MNYDNILKTANICKSNMETTGAGLNEELVSINNCFYAYIKSDKNVKKDGLIKFDDVSISNGITYKSGKFIVENKGLYFINWNFNVKEVLENKLTISFVNKNNNQTISSGSKSIDETTQNISGTALFEARDEDVFLFTSSSKHEINSADSFGGNVVIFKVN